ncbi:MAG TPA: methyltransferase domain-containing protein [Thermoplasmata archaeon]
MTVAGALERVRRIGADRFVASTGVVLVATLSSGGLAYAFQVLVGRSLGPESFGEFAALAGLLAFLLYLTSAVATIEARLVREVASSPSQVGFLLNAFYRRMAIVGAVSAAVTLLLSGYVAELLHLRSVALVWLLSVGVLGSFLLAVGQGGLQGLEKFRLLSATFLLNSGLRLAVGVGLVLLGHTIWGAVGAIVLGILCASIFGAFHLRAYLAARERTALPVRSPDLFARAAILATLFSSIPTNVDAMAVQHALPGLEAGIFSATAVLGRITYFVPSAVVLVFFPMAVSQSARPVPPSALVLKALTIAISASGTIALVLIAFAHPVVVLFFGESYMEATAILPLYLSSMIAFSASMVLMYYHLANRNAGPIYAATAAVCAGLVPLWALPVSLTQAVQILLLSHVASLAVLSATTVAWVVGHGPRRAATVRGPGGARIGRPQAPVPPEEYTGEYFRMHSERYDRKDMWARNRIEDIVESVVPQPGERILDVGCGIGIATMECARRGGILFAVDYAVPGLRLLKERVDHDGGALRVYPIRGLVDRLPMKAASVEKIVLADVAEHIFMDEFEQFIRESRRILRPGGQLFVYTPNAESLYFRIPERIRDLIKIYSAWLSVTRADGSVRSRITLARRLIEHDSKYERLHVEYKMPGAICDALTDGGFVIRDIRFSRPRVNRFAQRSRLERKVSKHVVVTAVRDRGPSEKGPHEP